MSMTIEEAIKHFTQQVTDKSVLSVAMGMDSPRMLCVVESIYEANALALKALREKAERENPAPLTIEELQHMNDQPVYVVPLPASGRDNAWEEWCVMYNDEAFIPGIEYVNWKLTDYNRTWIAYRHKPKEETT